MRLGDTPTANIQGVLGVDPRSGVLTAAVIGADSGRVYVSENGAAPHLVAEQPGLQAGQQAFQEGLSWIPGSASSFVFTLVPVVQGLEGPELVQVRVTPGMAPPIAPAVNTYTGPGWWTATSGTTPAGTTPAPSSSGLLNFLNTLPGGALPWLAGGGVLLLAIFKRKQA